MKLERLLHLGTISLVTLSLSQVCLAESTGFLRQSSNTITGKGTQGGKPVGRVEYRNDKAIAELLEGSNVKEERRRKRAEKWEADVKDLFDRKVITQKTVDEMRARYYKNNGGAPSARPVESRPVGKALRKEPELYPAQYVIEGTKDTMVKSGPGYRDWQRATIKRTYKLSFKKKVVGGKMQYVGELETYVTTQRFDGYGARPAETTGGKTDEFMIPVSEANFTASQPTVLTHEPSYNELISGAQGKSQLTITPDAQGHLTVSLYDPGYWTKSSGVAYGIRDWRDFKMKLSKN